MTTEKMKGIGSIPEPKSCDYSIAVGPQHPTHKEPMRWIFHVKGETIHDVDLRIGFNHRGIEKAFESRTYNQNLYLAERLCGICSNAHQYCYVQAAEKCANLYDEITERAQFIRILLQELERIQSHQLWYGVLAHDTGYDTMFHITWRDREIVSDILELISGNRVTYSMYTLGGVRRDISKEQIDKILPMVAEMKKRALYHKHVLESEKSFVVRQKDIAPLSAKDALRLCAVGPVVRAAGINNDIRRKDPPLGYERIPFDIPIYNGCDIYDAMRVRMDETLIACDISAYVLENLPAGDIRIKFPKRIPPNEGMSRVEAPRGEDIHYVRSNGTNKPDRHKIRAPTLGNMLSLVHRLKGAQVADIPPVIRVIDPCIGCCERATFIDVKSGKSKTLSNAHLISRANRAYRLKTKVLEF